MGTPVKEEPLIAQFNQKKAPPISTPIRACPLLAIDLETTGLNAHKDHIINIGWVPIRQGEMILAEARQYLIKSPETVGQSAQFHGLLDRDLKNARDLKTTLTELLETYGGYVFIGHHAKLEHNFLTRAIQRCFTGKPNLMFIDTLAIEQRQLTRRGIPLQRDALQLAQCLKRHQLPAIKTHHALQDAYGCALLFLAQTSKSEMSLKEVLRQSK